MAHFHNNALIGASGQGGYNITDSVRFRASGSTYLTRTPTSAGNRRTWTYSAWVKLGIIGNLNPAIFAVQSGTAVGTPNLFIWFRSAGVAVFQEVIQTSTTWAAGTYASFRDPSAWYHVVVSVDTTQATSSNRIKIYVNGIEQTLNGPSYPSQNYDTLVNSTTATYIGRSSTDGSNWNYFDGYMTDVYLIDGQALTPSSFGKTNPQTGVWQPIEYKGTYGTNGFYLPMKETTQATGFNTVLWTGNSGTQSITGVGFKPDFVWIKSRDSGSHIHILQDSVRGQGYSFFSNNTLEEYSDAKDLISSFDNDGFTVNRVYETDQANPSTNQSGEKYVGWCWDAGTINETPGYSAIFNGGTPYLTGPSALFNYNSSSTFTIEAMVRVKRYVTASTAYYNQSIVAKGDVYMNLCINDTGNLIFYHYDGTQRATASSGKVPIGIWTHVAVVVTGGVITYYINGSAAGTATFYGISSGGYSASSWIGQAHGNANAFYFRGEIANLRVSNIARTISVPTTAYTNDGNTDLLMFTTSNILTDSSSNAYSFTGLNNTFVNNTYPYMPWYNNTDGSINSYVRANPATGFSIVTSTHPASGNWTVGHGLGTAPKVVITKNRSSGGNWIIYHSELGNTKWLEFTIGAPQTGTSFPFNSLSPTSSVINYGNSTSWGASATAVAYCFSEVSGFSKFGSYTGTGSAGNFINTGFRPAMVIIKRTDTANDWWILDNVRESGVLDGRLIPSKSDAEVLDVNVISYTDNGFYAGGASGEPSTYQVNTNVSSGTYIYMAFADTRDFQWNFDASGNKNNWYPNNINSNASNETSYDLMSDTPSLADEDTGNFCTMNPLYYNSSTISESNLKAVMPISDGYGVRGTFLMPRTGKWYWETYSHGTTSPGYHGIVRTSHTTSGTSNAIVYGGGYAIKYGSTIQSGGTNNDNYKTLGIAFDMDNGKVWFAVDGVWQFSGNPSSGTSEAISFTITNEEFVPYGYNNSGSYALTSYWNFGQRPFKYTPPTGYKKLNTYNLTDSSITDGSQYMDVVLWTGNGVNPRSITGLNFKPDFVWLKSRSQAYDHQLYDSNRGVTKALYSSGTYAEVTNQSTGTLQSFNNDGFTLGGTTHNNDVNGNTYTFTSWNWKANGTAVTNTNGTITSTVSANPTSGFSVVTYTGNGVNGATIGHGLGVKPNIIIFKNRSATSTWTTYSSVLGATKFLFLNTTAAAGGPEAWLNNTEPTSSLITLSNYSDVNSNGNNYVAYCFAEVAGFSKFGSYTGNGSADGPFVYTGFRPAFVMIKRTDVVANWNMIDSSRSSYNVVGNELYANLNNAEATGNTDADFLSNGFKLRNTYASENGSGGTYIYMAFAENPFKNSLAR